ncbi:MAG: aldo/keto reductase [Planctomycetes bacterium]|nr:aldo/keto reductase [Planctomycetota bacterium]
MAERRVTRREFLRDGAIGAAGAAAVGLGAVAGCRGPERGADPAAAIPSTRSYNPAMEYRRLGKTGLWVSAVCLGGHWKRVNKAIGSQAPFGACEAIGDASKADLDAFYRNRHDVVTRCMDVGINLIDFAGDAEPGVYTKVLGDRLDRMYLAWSFGAQEMRHPEHRTAAALVEILEKGLERCGAPRADIWRVMAYERGSDHTEAEVEEMMKALDIARTRGLCRFTGLSTHDRPWAKMLSEKYPDLVQVLCTPYTADSKVLPQDSLFETVRRADVGVLGIKPFANNSLFAGDGSPDGPHVEEDDRRARMAIRTILANPALTAPIPGLATPHQVDNVARAVGERRELDLAEREELQTLGREMWASLPPDYGWLREWEYV